VTERRRLPNRRLSTNFDIESHRLPFTVTATIEGGELREVFINNHKAGSAAGIMASDAAVVCSIALQYGVPVEVIRKALARDAQGRASGPLGVALDRIAELEQGR
jgi:hypothetical protein